MPDSPNVLILMDDEHHPDIAGFAGDDVVRTPTLDWLAETGTTFTNAYTPAPSCVPARHSMRTGQLPRTWDRFGLDAFESAEYRTLPLQMARHGYMTASGGKEHYPGWNEKEVRRAGVADSRTQVQDRRVIEGIEQYVREFFSSPYYDRAQPDTPLLLKGSLIEPFRA